MLVFPIAQEGLDGVEEEGGGGRKGGRESLCVGRREERDDLNTYNIEVEYRSRSPWHHSQLSW